MSKKLSAVHPGEVLRQEFLVPMKAAVSLSPARLPAQPARR
jgi:plasmid maintenance system antidote protein VapI